MWIILKELNLEPLISGKCLTSPNCSPNSSRYNIYLYMPARREKNLQSLTYNEHKISPNSVKLNQNFPKYNVWKKKI